VISGHDIEVDNVAVEGGGLVDIVDGKLFFATGSILSFAGNEYEFGTESSVINIVG